MPKEGPAAQGGGGAGNVNRTAARNALWMFAVTAVIALGFYFLNTPLAAIREQLAPWFEQVLPYTEKGDIWLASVQEKIRNAAVSLGDAIMYLIRHGDQYTVRWQQKIADFVPVSKEKIARLLKRDKLNEK